MSLVCLEVLLVLRVDAVEDLLREIVHGHIVGEAPVLLGVLIVNRLGPGVGDLLAEVGFVGHLEAGDEFLDSGRELLRVERYARHVVDFALKFGTVGVQELNRRLDAIVDVDHRESGLRAEPALVGALLKGREEDLGRIICGAIEIVLFAADDAGVANRAEVYTELVVIVGSNHLVEDLADAVDSLRLQHCVYRGVHLREVVAPKDSDGRRHEDEALVLSRNIQGIDAPGHVDRSGAVREPLAESREDGGEVDDVVDLVLTDYLVIAREVCHVKLLVSARQSHLLVADVRRDHIVFSYFVAQGLDQGHSDLALAAGHEDPATFLGYG